MKHNLRHIEVGDIVYDFNFNVWAKVDELYDNIPVQYGEYNYKLFLRSFSGDAIYLTFSNLVYPLVEGRTYKGHKVVVETHLEEYPYYCPDLQENCYECELD